MADLQSSSLCDERQWEGLDGDALAELYDKTISELLHHQFQVQLITCRRWPTSTWFDDEKAARRAGPLSNIDPPADKAWRAQRRQYFELLRLKRSAFWSTRVDAEQSQPRRLWRSFDELLGRGRVPPSTDSSASDLHSFFVNKMPEYVLPLLTQMHCLSPLCVAAVFSCHTC